MVLKYRLRWAMKGEEKVRVYDMTATSPISAINQFHTAVQSHREVSSDRRTVIRPILKPDQYEVLSLHQIYHDAAFHRDPGAQPIIESTIDYPKSPNPAILHDKRGGRDPFASDCPGQPEFSF